MDRLTEIIASLSVRLPTQEKFLSELQQADLNVLL